MLWQRWCAEHDLHALDGSVLNAQLFMEWLEESYSSSSVQSRFSGVCRWFDYLLEHGVIKGHGFRNVKRPKRVRNFSAVRIPTPTEMEVLMEGAAAKGVRWEWLVGMMAYCGLDSAEALRVTATHVRTWEGRTLVTVSSRRQRRREVPVDGRLEVLTLGLSSVFGPAIPLAGKLTSDWVQKYLKILSVETVGRHITVQDLRRHAVMRQADRGVPIAVIAKWLGHTTDEWVRTTLGMESSVAAVSTADVIEQILVEPDGDRFGAGRAHDSLIDGAAQPAG
jgi:integrase